MAAVAVLGLGHPGEGGAKHPSEKGRTGQLKCSGPREGALGQPRGQRVEGVRLRCAFFSFFGRHGLLPFPAPNLPNYAKSEWACIYAEWPLFVPLRWPGGYSKEAFGGLSSLLFTNCREGTFSETELPTIGFLGNPPTYHEARPPLLQRR